MANKLQSNWMGGSNHVPVKYRSSTKGKVFSRTEKIRIVLNERIQKMRKANIRELILIEKENISREREARSKNYKMLNVLLEQPLLKVKTDKNGRKFIQPRNERGGFLPKMTFQ